MQFQPKPFWIVAVFEEQSRGHTLSANFINSDKIHQISENPKCHRNEIPERSPIRDTLAFLSDSLFCFTVVVPVEFDGDASQYLCW